MNILRRFLVSISLLLVACSDKQDEPVTPEVEISTEPVTSREAKSDLDDSGQAKSSFTVGKNEEVADDSVAGNSPGNYPQATPVPDQLGFVYSPYNHQIIDVRDIPSGTLVADPTYPMSEKKYFRVP